MLRNCFIASVCLVGTVPCLAIDPTVAKPPVAKVVPYKTELHGDTLIDHYYWLREKKNPEVLAYLKAENEYTAAVMKPTEAFQERLYKEMLGRIKQSDVTVPAFENGFWYYTRTEEGKQYAIHCRRKGSMDSPEEIFLDGNEIAAGKKFFGLGAVHVSDDGTLVAYVADFSGFREYFVTVKDLRNGRLIEERFVQSPNIEWAADNKTLFYVTEDDAKRPHKLWQHSLGQPKEKDVLVFEEKDELFTLQLNRSRDNKYLFHTSESSTTSEQAFLPADKPTGEWKVIRPRVEGHEYTADHRDGKFYIRTNTDKATNFKVMTCPATKTDAGEWKDLLPYNSKILVNSVSMFKDFAVIGESEGGLTELRVFDFAGGANHRLIFTEPVYDVSMTDNPDFAASSFRFQYTSLVKPDSIFEYDPSKKKSRLLKETPVLGGYDATKYQSERILATASDGTKVPISLVYRKGIERDGKAPLLLYAYGSYGYTLPVDFESSRLSLLDRGVIYAQAHIRGGSDMGREWYDNGKLMHKKNTFTDFIACADHLVKEKYCSRDRLAIQGGSAGGLLIGATVALRPDVCKVGVLQVPFVDVINTMLDETLPLTTQEFLEWGNPKQKPAYEYMKSYCPYSNMTKRDYPSILVTTSLNDSQVMYWEPAKYVAKMRAMKTDKNPLLFRCNMDGGHGGYSGRYEKLKEQAFVFAYVLDQIGVKE